MYIVTGNLGFIGRHLTSRLDALGEKWVGADIVADSDVAIAHNRSRLVPLDYQGAEGFHTWIHLAAESDIRGFGAETRELQLHNTLYSVNEAIESIRALNEAGGSINKIVFTSSQAVYGDGTAPMSFYGACKLGAEGILNSWYHQDTKSRQVSILRLGNVVGPGCRGLLPETIAKLRDNPDVLNVLGDGNAEKPFVHVVDVVDCIINSVHGVWDVRSLDSMSVRDTAQLIARRMGLNPQTHYVYDSRNTFAGGWLGDQTKPKSSGIELHPGLALTRSADAVDRALSELLSETATKVGVVCGPRE